MQIGAIIDSIRDESIADEIGLDIGDEILSINEQKPRDIIDYSFLIQDELINVAIKKKNGEEEIIEIEKDYDEDLGISFKSAVFDKIKPCCNKCIFCFVDQQPKGLRDSLYVKDDDWRLSYLQGTYITFTNFMESDWERLTKLRLSPLYVSIHTTNPELRSKMLNNRRAGEILSCLERLKKNNIDFHGQIVLCPGYNDGYELKKTLNDLKKFKKNMKSLAVVPIGVSKYRKEKLKSVDDKIALETIKMIDDFNSEVKRNIACASDEFFLLSKKEIPPKKYYGNFSQIEDGVGAIRLFLDDFDKSSKKLKKKLKKKTKLTLATGHSACQIFSMIMDKIKVDNLEFELVDVPNKFFGEKINVAGLIVGQDLIDALKGKDLEHLAIPSIMLREGTEEFLDGMTLDDVREAIGVKIHIIRNCYNFSDFVTIINSF